MRRDGDIPESIFASRNFENLKFFRCRRSWARKVANFKPAPKRWNDQPYLWGKDTVFTISIIKKIFFYEILIKFLIVKTEFTG